MNIIPKGSIIHITQDEYSFFVDRGIYKAKQDIDIVQLRLSFCEKETNRSADDF